MTRQDELGAALAVRDASLERLRALVAAGKIPASELQQIDADDGTAERTAQAYETAGAILAAWER